MILWRPLWEKGDNIGPPEENESMDDSASAEHRAMHSAPGMKTVWNVPNQLTVARLVLSIFCFVFLAFHWYLPAGVLFAIAAGTDWVDGYWARKYGQITQLGRVLDPFADKIVICGAFIFLAAVPPAINGNTAQPASEITAWMAVVVVGRELLVTALRTFFEEQDIDFSAQWAGKWKMVFQCMAAGASFARLWYYEFDAASPPTWGTVPREWTTWSLRLLVWVAVIMTVYSGWGYVQTALRLMKR
jgi:CDP-diacylglycerol---glycerol-3-phosphate 3-phosphatidyltransferase